MATFMVQIPKARVPDLFNLGSLMPLALVAFGLLWLAAKGDARRQPRGM